MTFADGAFKLCGHAAVLLGWRPNEFWSATPAELECVLTALVPQSEPPPGAKEIQQMMEQFPDG